MWLLFAFISSSIVGVRDTLKKQSLVGNDLFVVLMLNILLMVLFFGCLMGISHGTDWLGGTFLYIPPVSGGVVLRCLPLAAMTLGVWFFGYMGFKHLPLSIAGIINAMGPIMVVVGASFVYGEQLNATQVAGVAVSVISMVTLSRSGSQEGIRFSHNRWIWAMLLSAVFSASAALYDKYLMGRVEDGGLGMDVMMVQCWISILQLPAACLLVWLRHRRFAHSGGLPFRFRWSIVWVSICQCLADVLYCAALQMPGAMVSMLAMIRRGSVIISFCLGVWIFHEVGVRRKLFDLLLVIVGMVLLYIGSR